MEKNNYARLLSFATTTAGKFTSIVLAIAMVFGLTSAVYAIEGVIEAQADDDAPIENVQELPGAASVNFVAQNCVIEMNGQPVEGVVDVAPGSNVSFTVVPNEGHQIYSVIAFDSLGNLPLDGGDGAFSIAGDFVYGALSVEAVSVEDPDNPRDSTPTTVIEEDTVVDDGQLIPGVVLPAPVIVLEDAVRTYNGLPLDTTAYTVEGLQEGDELVCTFAGGQTEVGSSTVSVASYVIWRNGENVTAFYEQAELPSATVTVEKAPLNITTPSATKTYDGEPLVYSGDVNEGDAASVEELWGTDMVDFRVTGSQTEVGSSPNTYTLEWVEGDPSNYEVVENIGTLTVLSAEDAIYAIAPSASKTYDGTPVNAGSVMWAGLPEGFTAQAEYSGEATNAGTVATQVDKESVRIFNADGEDVTAYYPVETIDGEIVVDRAPLTVTTGSARKAADGTPLTAGGSITGLVNGETATLVVTGIQPATGTSANSYRIDWDGTARPSNYQVFEDLGVLEITEPAAVTPDSGTGNQSSASDGRGGNASSATPSAPSQPTGPAQTDPANNSGASNTAAGNTTENAAGETPAAQGGEQPAEVVYVEVPAAETPTAQTPVADPAEEVVYESVSYDTYAPAANTYVPAATATVLPGGTSTSAAAPSASATTGGSEGAGTESAEGSGSSSADGAGSSTAGGSAASEGSTDASEEEPINPVVEAVATGMQNLEQVVVGDEPTPLAAPATGSTPDGSGSSEETLADNETPLGVFDEPVECWVHWYAILGLIATAIYGAVVMFFRRAYSYELESREAVILGAPAGVVPAQVPSSGGQAGREA